MAIAMDKASSEVTEEKLRASLRGPLLRPDDDGYDAARRVWNRLIDQKPALVIRCAGVADVIHAVNFAHSRGLPVAVRGSGHNVAGHAVCDDGVVIDLSLMKGIRVDPAHQTVRAEAGLTWGELDHETQVFGLATTGAKVSTVGIAGVTLGGGLGWLMRKWGLAVDNLLSADVVTANGQYLVASSIENPELFWGVRGGGGNFGVVTSFEYRLHPVGPLVTGGILIYSVTLARDLLRFYREFMAAAPDELAALFTFWTAPPVRSIPAHLHGKLIVSVLVCHSGPIEEGMRSVAALRRFGPPLLDRIGPMPYVAVQRLFDQAGAYGQYVYVKSDHLTDLGDDAIDTLVTHAQNVTSPSSVVLIFTLGGAVSRIGPNETAYSHRHARFNYAIYSMWANQDESMRHIEWTREFWTAMEPFSAGAYVNELGDEGEDRVRAAYTPETYDRLVALKNRYDPTNLFHVNQNVKPRREGITTCD